MKFIEIIHISLNSVPIWPFLDSFTLAVAYRKYNILVAASYTGVRWLCFGAGNTGCTLMFGSGGMKY